MVTYWQFFLAASSYALPVVVLLGLAGLYREGMRLAALLRDSVVLRLPVAPRQHLRVPEGQRYDFLIERAWLSRDFAKARFWMRDAEGKPVELRPSFIRYEIGTLVATRQFLWNFQAPADGRLELFMDGVAEPPGYRSCILIQRPTGSKFIRHILTMLVFALITVWAALGTVQLWSEKIRDVVL